MKFNRLIVVLQNKSGGCYQVALSETERQRVVDLIAQSHDNKIKIVRPKLPFTLEDKMK